MKITLNAKEILGLRLDGYTYQYIANKANVTRQRIQQVLSPPMEIRDFVAKKYGNRCADCGIYVGKSGHIHHENLDDEERYDNINNLRLLCISCHRKKHEKPPQFKCRYCNQPIKSGLFCSRECLTEYHRATLICSYCGEKWSLYASQAQARVKRSQSGLIFCSKYCQGKWLAENYGFGVYPEHRPYTPNHKWDWDKVMELQRQTGQGCCRLSRALNIPQQTISNILRKRRLVLV